MKIETRIEKTISKVEKLEVVSIDGRDIGFLTKYSNTRTEKHPWKAYKGIGFSAEFIGAFYPQDGGKRKAIEAITN